MTDAAHARYDVFLSHNSADKPAVEELAHRLKQEGIEPWLDKWNLVPGRPWQPALEEALDQCAGCAVFVGPSDIGPWQHAEMRAAIDRRVSGSHGQFAVIPVLLPGGRRDERTRLPTFLVQSTWVEFRKSLDEEDAFRRLLCGIRGQPPGPGQAPFEGQCPYRGLAPFRAEDRRFFFGREALTEWLLEQLRPPAGGKPQNRFVAVVGPSGSGKSSLVLAGLLPALADGKLEGSAAWPRALCRPGPDPLESVAVALCHALGEDAAAVRELRDELRGSEAALHLKVRLALHGAPAERRLLLVLDQFEEVFTLCTDEGQRRALLDNLLYAAGAAGGQTVLVLTLRADFYGKCAAYPVLAAALSEHPFLVGPLSEAELRQAIERPAQLVGCECEPGLVEALLRDVQGQAGALPLLQDVLLQLWQARQGRRLTVEAYQALGGLSGALDRRASDVLKRFSPAEQELCRRIFLRLTQPGEGTEDTKRRAALHELAGAGDAEVVARVVGRLADQRLLTTEGDAAQAQVEVAHEALIRGWSVLRHWVEADRAGLRTHHRLGEAAREWDHNQREDSFLYRGARLAVAQEWAAGHAHDLNDLETAFLAASAAAETQRRDQELAQARRLADERADKARRSRRAWRAC
jgi:energy-coupling factor transporter ATP-binding protein EcfA2